MATTPLSTSTDITIDPHFEPNTRKVLVANSYGPTETTVCATVYECLAPDRETIPIGRPVAGKRIYILDEHAAPVPLGTTGEIYIGGTGVARGYWNQPELTQRRFLPDPYGAQPGARMYRTGDLGRWLPDGHVEFLGRNDHQVKIRGFRIELGEIESRLTSCQGVREAVVLAREDEGGQKRLVAYVTADPGTELATTLLRSELADLLPDYMVPSAFVVLNELPLTPNGKVDRQALPALNPSAVSDLHVAPRNATEAAVSQVWATLLQLDRVGVTDNFFDLGGHSLLIVRLHQELDQMYPGRLAMPDFFTHTTVEQIAAFLGGEQDQDAPAELGVSRAEVRKRSAAQQRDRRSKLGRHLTTGG